MKKIIHIIIGLNDGGAESVLYRLISDCHSFEHKVVSLMDEGKYGPLLINHGIELFTLNLKRGKLSIFSLFKLYKIIKQEKPNVIQTWMYHADFIGGVVARLAGIRNIYWGIRHGDVYSKKTKLTTRILARLCALTSYHIPKKIICCAEVAAKEHKKIGYNKKIITIIENGIDTEKFSFHKKKSRSIPKIGMVARFDPIKDHINLIKSLEIVKNSGFEFECSLVGTNITYKNIEITDIIKKHDLTDYIKLEGPSNDIPSIMRDLDLHILSSRSEAFPNVLIEAMACGTPCVSTDVGDARAIIDQYGWLCIPNDPIALSEKIIEALKKIKNKQCWNQLIIDNRKRIEEKFSLTKMKKKYEEIWSEK